MRGKILFVAGAAVGYVLGARAGRERYEQISDAASRFWGSPKVQRRVDSVEGFVKDHAPDVAEMVGEGTKKVVNQVTGRATSGGSKSRSAKRSSGSSGSAGSSS